MGTLYGLNLEEGEKILWMGKRSIRSLWLPFVAGIIFILMATFMTGISLLLTSLLGVLFILYGISRWLRVDYVITSERALKITRHYAFIYLLKYDVEEIRRERIRSFYSLEKGIPGIKYWNLIIENGGKIVFTGLGDTEEVKKILSKGED
ncbi:MAG TPA: hypothetical protein ENJ70_01870 [Thermoplasmatales archaeon]|nr:hypothetical protein [Thermoplasmatales archaeon]